MRVPSTITTATMDQHHHHHPHHHNDTLLAARRTLKRRLASLFLAVAFCAAWMQAAVLFPGSISSRNSSSTKKECRGKERVLEILDRAQENAIDDDDGDSQCRVSRLLAASSLRDGNTKHGTRQQHEFGKTTCNVRDMCDQLPSWKQVAHLYGDEPVVLGTETCSKLLHQSSSNSNATTTVRVAGLYNSGTNAVAAALNDNFPDDWTIVDDDKHASIKYHTSDTAKLKDALTVVVVRDPFRWMGSMCKTNYDVHWMRAPHKHCPNLVPIEGDWNTPLRKRITLQRKISTYKVKVKTTTTSANDKQQQQKGKYTNVNVDDEYDSLADMWTEWYRPYIQRKSNDDFPRLVVRFEDFLFHREHVMSQIAQCVSSGTATTTGGGSSGNVQQQAPPPPQQQKLKYRMASAKSHGRSSNLVSAMIKYGRTRGRYAGMAIEDLRYAAKALDADLLQELHYLAVPDV